MCLSSRWHVVSVLSLVRRCAYLLTLDSCSGAALATADMLHYHTFARPLSAACCARLYRDSLAVRLGHFAQFRLQRVECTSLAKFGALL